MYQTREKIIYFFRTGSGTQAWPLVEKDYRQGPSLTLTLDVEIKEVNQLGSTSLWVVFSRDIAGFPYQMEEGYPRLSLSCNSCILEDRHWTLYHFKKQY